MASGGFWGCNISGSQGWNMDLLLKNAKMKMTKKSNLVGFSISNMIRDFSNLSFVFSSLVHKCLLKLGK